MKHFTLGSSKSEILDLIPERQIKKIRLGEKEIALIRLGEDFYGFQLFCPHRGASLLSAFTNGVGELICPLHEYRFDLKSGQVKSGFCENLEVFACTLTEEGLKIQIPYDQ